VTFFSLPRELRDAIYIHALGSCQRSFHYARVGFLLSPSAPEPTQECTIGLPPWLLTCHSICDEAVDPLLRVWRFSPNTTVHQCKPSPPLKGRCIAQWHPPCLTMRQRAHMKLEQQQHPQREFKKQLGRKVPKRHIPSYTSAKPATVWSCSPVSQSVLLHADSVHHIAFNLPVNLTFQRSTYYALNITVVNDVRPWFEFLAIVYPFLRASDLHLTLSWDSKEPEHLEPYFEWPQEWLGRFARVDVALLAAEAHSMNMKQRIEVVVKKLVGDRRKGREPTIWNMEPVYEEPTLPPCEVHGEACPHLELQRTRRSEMSKYIFSVSS
jgi:hypothetical protein